jgi:hypothetical protein
MNIIDVLIILVLIISFIVGMGKGIIKSSISFIGLVIILVLSFVFKDNIGNNLCKYLPFIHFGGKLTGITTINILLYQTIGFLIIFSFLYIIYTIVVKLSSLLQKLLNSTIILKLPSKLLGGVVQLFEGYLIVFIVLLVLSVIMLDNPLLNKSYLRNKILKNTPIISQHTNKAVKSTDEIYNLVIKVDKKKITINEANLKIVDLMLKHKVVSKKTIEQLIVLDKLDEIKNLDKVLKKY